MTEQRERAPETEHRKAASRSEAAGQAGIANAEEGHSSRNGQCWRQPRQRRRAFQAARGACSATARGSVRKLRVMFPEAARTKARLFFFRRYAIGRARLCSYLPVVRQCRNRSVLAGVRASSPFPLPPTGASSSQLRFSASFQFC